MHDPLPTGSPDGRTHPAPSSRYTPPQIEVEAVEAITVDWDGLQVTLPASLEDWDPDALEAFETGKVITALRHLLGSAPYDELRATWRRAHGRRPVMRDLTRLFEEIATAYGFENTGE